MHAPASARTPPHPTPPHPTHPVGSQGYDDVGIHHPPAPGSNKPAYIQSPNLDRFISKSLEFDNFYVAPMCSQVGAPEGGREGGRLGVTQPPFFSHCTPPPPADPAHFTKPACAAMQTRAQLLTGRDYPKTGTLLVNGAAPAAGSCRMQLRQPARAPAASRPSLIDRSPQASWHQAAASPPSTPPPSSAVCPLTDSACHPRPPPAGLRAPQPTTHTTLLSLPCAVQAAMTS
jgi:hypothetical protein